MKTPQSSGISIVVDQDIPFLQGVLEPYASVDYRKGNAIQAGAVRDADALLVRTRTRCDEQLLAGSSVSFVGSATIGADHVDEEALRRCGIAFANVPGCNAGGVLQYVFTALYGLIARGTEVLAPDPDGYWAQGHTMGVIGVGHVGSRVVRLARSLGFRVLCSDPPREKDGSALYRDLSGVSYVPLSELLHASDVVMVHVPLDPGTKNMIRADFLAQMKPGSILINASRGPIADGNALLAARKCGALGGLILDVWPEEPRIDPELLAVADWASPHIAGYSLEGKVNATNGVVRALARHFGWTTLLDFDALPSALSEGAGLVEPWPVTRLAKETNRELARRFEAVFDLPAISRRLKEHPEDFETFRAEFDFRPEFSFVFPEKGF